MLLLFLIIPGSVYAQAQSEVDVIDLLFPKKRPGKAGKDTVLQPGKAEVVVIPLIGYNPANGAVFGIRNYRSRNIRTQENNACIFSGIYGLLYHQKPV